MAEKSYQELQADAKLLGIKANLPQNELILVIATATSPEAVAELTKNLKEVNEINSEISERHNIVVVGLNTTIAELQEAAVTNAETIEELHLKIEGLLGQIAEGGQPTGQTTDESVEKLQQLVTAALAEKDVRTNMYKTGCANGLMRAVSIFTGVDPDMIEPLDIKRPDEAVPLSGRQQAINELKKYVNTRPGGGLRSGLADGDKEKADKLLEALGMEKGKYVIPKE